MFRGDCKETTVNQDLFNRKYKIQKEEGDAAVEYKEVNASAFTIVGRDDGPQKDAFICSPLPYSLSDNQDAIQGLFQTGFSTIDQELAHFGDNDAGAIGIIGFYAHQNKNLSLAQLGDGVAFLVIRVISTGEVLFATQLNEISDSLGQRIFGFASDKESKGKTCTPYTYHYSLNIPDNCEAVLGVATLGVSEHFVLEDIERIFRENPHEGLASIAQQIVADKLGPGTISNASILLAVLDQSLQMGLFDGRAEDGARVSNYLARHSLRILDNLIDQNKKWQQPLTADEKKSIATKSQSRKIEQLAGLRYTHYVSDNKPSVATANMIATLKKKFEEDLFKFDELHLFHNNSRIIVERAGQDDYVCRQEIVYKAAKLQPSGGYAEQFPIEFELVKTTASSGLVQACYCLNSVGTTFLGSDRLGSPEQLGAFFKRENMARNIAESMASLSREHKGSQMWRCCLTEDQVSEVKQTVTHRVGEIKGTTKTPEAILAEVTFAQISGHALPFFSYLVAYDGSLSKVYSPLVQQLHKALLAYRQFCFSYSIAERLVEIEKIRNLVNLIEQSDDQFYNPMAEIRKNSINWQKIKNIFSSEDVFLRYYAPAFSPDPYVPSLLLTPSAALNVKSPSGWMSPKIVVPSGLGVAAGVILPPIFLAPVAAFAPLPFVATIIISGISGTLGAVGLFQGLSSDKRFKLRVEKAAHVCPAFVSRQEQPLTMSSDPALAVESERKREFRSSSGITLELGEVKAVRRFSTSKSGLGLLPSQSENKASSAVANPDIILNIDKVDAPHLTGKKERPGVQNPSFLAVSRSMRRPSVFEEVKPKPLPFTLDKPLLEQFTKLKTDADKSKMLLSEYKTIFNEIEAGVKGNMFANTAFLMQFAILLSDRFFSKFIEKNQLVQPLMQLVYDACAGKTEEYRDKAIVYVLDTSPYFNNLPGMVSSAKQNSGPGR